MKAKTLKDVKLPLGSSVTANLHGAPKRHAPRPAERSVRQVVASWHNRYPGQHHSNDDLLAAYRLLEPHQQELASLASAAPRLFAALSAQLTLRNLL